MKGNGSLESYCLKFCKSAGYTAVLLETVCVVVVSMTDLPKEAEVMFTARPSRIIWPCISVDSQC